ncbi:sulfatase family protein [Pelagicoccus mobilis]|uniref:Sulfatase n=1 Tax=Pelagicoccus mobilis TaxID=415221 RepID=A0A934S238_9BACT|nr:sulfatase [Pelagicoccus mobilis]MBK1879765.1 sulfatase [Pelagicoccus mobilis]
MLILSLLCLSFQASAESVKPNILLIIGDDATYSDLSLYGGENVKTPRIDTLATEGMTFDQAYVSMAMCAPCRASIQTGLYPFRSGVAWNHAPAREGTKSSFHYLKDLGYRVGLTGKTHLRPASVYPYETVSGVEPDCVADTSYFEAAPIKEFMTRDREQPFALTVALTSPHAPWTVGDPSKFDQKAFKMPPHLADTEETREWFARYLAEIEVLDEQVGQTLDILAETGLADNTIVIFTSEQGAQFPGAKWTNWSAGVKTGFVVRWPGKVEAGVRTDALVQYCDVLPTLLDAVGGTFESDAFDGSSFLSVLNGESERHRDYAFFMHNNVPEGPPYPIRGVTDGDFHYLENLEPDRIYIEKHLMAKVEHNGYVPSMFWTAGTDERSYEALARFMSRPGEELYRNENDPHQLNNLAESVEYAEVKARMAKALGTWRTEQGDPGAALDRVESHKAAKKQRHFASPLLNQ